MNTIEKIQALIKYFTNLSYVNQISQKCPIMIGGCGRSGTTLLLSILGSHPKIQAIDDETRFFKKKKHKINSKYKLKILLFNKLLKHKKSTAHRWVEKTPKNITNIPEIEKYFDGNVKIIHIIRDGRDVVTSRHPTQKQKYHVSVERWVDDVNEGLKYENYMNVYTLKYEDLISKFDNTMEGLMDFLDEKYVTEVKNFVNHTNVRKNEAWDKDVQIIHMNSLEKWKREEHSYRMEEFYDNKMAVQLLGRLGYKL